MNAKASPTTLIIGFSCLSFCEADLSTNGKKDLLPQ